MWLYSLFKRKRMRKSLYIEILRKLYDEGIGFEMDITNCFDTYSLEADNIFEAMGSSRKVKIDNYLKVLETNGHITNSTVLVINSKDDGIKRWINDEFKITSILTANGYVFIHNYLSDRDTRINRLIQHTTTFIALILSGLAIYATLIPYLHPKEETMKNDVLMLKQHLMKLEKKQQEILTKEIGNKSLQTDSLHKH